MVAARFHSRRRTGGSSRVDPDDKVDSVVDGYNVSVRRIAVLTLPRRLVTCSVLKSGVASKEAVRFKKSSEH